jgi:short-subunit dehydrogenase
MRKQGRRTIIIIGSLGGRAGLLPFLTQYHASKFALEGFIESLREELAHLQKNPDSIFVSYLFT